MPFGSDFPFAYRFLETSQRDCKDLRSDMLAFSTVMSTVFGLILATSAAVFYWVSVCFGYWHITLASDPRDFPRKSGGFSLSQRSRLTLGPCSGPSERLWIVFALSLHLLRLLAVCDAVGHPGIQ